MWLLELKNRIEYGADDWSIDRKLVNNVWDTHTQNTTTQNINDNNFSNLFVALSVRARLIRLRVIWCIIVGIFGVGCISTGRLWWPLFGHRRRMIGHWMQRRWWHHTHSARNNTSRWLLEIFFQTLFNRFDQWWMTFVCWTWGIKHLWLRFGSQQIQIGGWEAMEGLWPFTWCWAWENGAYQSGCFQLIVIGRALILANLMVECFGRFFDGLSLEFANVLFFGTGWRSWRWRCKAIECRRFAQRRYIVYLSGQCRRVCMMLLLLNMLTRTEWQYFHASLWRRANFLVRAL